MTLTPVTELRPIQHAAAPRPAVPAEIAEAEQLLDSLKRCAVWLLRNGVGIVGFVGSQSFGPDRIVVTVTAPAARLHVLMPDCECCKRGQDGALTVFTWTAVRFGLRIEWRETTCH